MGDIKTDEIILDLFMIQCTEDKEVVCVKRKEKTDYIHGFEWDVRYNNNKGGLDLKVWDNKRKIYIDNIERVEDEESYLTLKTKNGNIMLESL